MLTSNEPHREEPQPKDTPSESKPDDRQLRSASLALTIPGLMIAGPIAGLLFGRWLGGKVGHADGGSLVGAVLGFAACVHEVIKILRRMSK